MNTCYISEVSQKEKHKYCILMHILKKEMSTNSGILTWETPRMEDADRLQSMDCTCNWTQLGDKTKTGLEKMVWVNLSAGQD